MQIVYISIRPSILEETLEYVQYFMPYIEEAIIVAPGCLLSSFSSHTNIRLHVIPEELALQAYLKDYKNTQNHQAKNLLLRASLADIGDIDESFILSDDDYRPIDKVERSVFEEQGVQKGYYCYDLLDWPSNTTDYDQGICWTGKYLQTMGFKTLCFSSHMPQIVRKKCFGDSLSLVLKNNPCPVIADEWSIYFNYMSQYYSETTSVDNIYRTLNWPPLPTDWPVYVETKKPLFENYYPYLYSRGNIYEGLPTKFDPDNWRQTYLEKVRRRTAVDITFKDLVQSNVGKNIFQIYNWFRRNYPRTNAALKPALLMAYRSWASSVIKTDSHSKTEE